MEYGELFSQIRQLCKMGKQEKVWKMYYISHAAPYYSDVIMNFDMLNALLLKDLLLQEAWFQFWQGRHESQISSMTLANEIGE